MTYCVRDPTPSSWHKLNFNSVFLGEVTKYITDHKIEKFHISGAITFNSVCGPSCSTVSIQNLDDFNGLVKWFDEGRKMPLEDCIWIGVDPKQNLEGADLTADDNTGLRVNRLPPELARFGPVGVLRGSKVENLPEGGNLEDAIAEIKENSKKSGDGQ